MRSSGDNENEVYHPLRKIILLEYEQALADSLAASIPAGAWTPSSSYIVLIAKRSGTYREMAFPCLVDSIVGRRIIDALESDITHDDNNRVFFGRAHSNADRARGDYGNWFEIWQDFSSSIAHALESGGFTYVFDTDITQFFPSVDRERAKQALAQRTQAHQTLLELLFYCIEAWAPRVRYCAVPGLPIEPNDVSRLIAHNYIKSVDEHFVNDPAVHYLRWVDDTVVFVSNEAAAHEVKRKHHLALREIGLSPNASKTAILSAEAYAQSRHPEFNKRIKDVKFDESEDGLRALVDEWYAKDREQTPSWDKVAARLYGTSRDLKSAAIGAHAFEDIERHERLQHAIFRYLMDTELNEEEMLRLINFYGKSTTSIESRMEIARFLCDVRLSFDGSKFLNRIIGEIMVDDIRLGSGFARSLLLLFLNKHGGKEHRERITKHFTLDRLQDNQLRLHFLYIFHCRGELDESLVRAARHLDTPDIALLMRLCQDVKEGKLSHFAKCLAVCVPKKDGVRSIRAQYLPFLHALLHAQGKELENRAWLIANTSAQMIAEVKDSAIRRFLEAERVLATH